MRIRNLIETTIRETFAYPVLFLPFFVISLLNTVLASDLVVSAIGPNISLIINLLILALLVPIANSITIVMDRGIVSERGPGLDKAVDFSFRKAFLLIGINFIAWMATFTGLILLIVPGIFLYVKLIFVTQEIVLGGAEDFETGLRASWSHTTGHWMHLFSLLLVLELPLLVLSLLSGELPIGLGQTFQVILSTLAQTWIIIVFTHTYVRIRNQG